MKATVKSIELDSRQCLERLNLWAPLYCLTFCSIDESIGVIVEPLSLFWRPMGGGMKAD